MQSRFYIKYLSSPGEAAAFSALSRSKPFKEIFRRRNIKKAKKKASKNPTHIFKATIPRLQDNIFLCLTGNTKKLGSFDPHKPLLFREKKNGKSTLKIDLSKSNFPVEYKFAFYDADKKMIIDYEPGPNRFMESAPEYNEMKAIYPSVSFDKYLWKGAGINIPVFSLRTENSWGCGDFSDIKLVADWAAAAGFKLIQLLPVNDTCAEFTDKDSYPYSAVTSFGLHPQFLNVEQIARHAGIEISDKERKEINRLNGLSAVNYSAVVQLKLQVIKRVFEKERYNFNDDPDWFGFFDMNREWLLPYAVFCTLREQYGTADHTKWEEHAAYNEENIQEFASPGSSSYSSVLFWYYIQYQLHLQLENAAEYGHKKGIALKADLPIGVGRPSADTWQHPQLFHMDMQAGAPPDAFSDRGQNWLFPTYNVPAMEAENFLWFRRRMEHLEQYFDAVRIDHVLGLFRIWSIPVNETDARLGRFVPAIPLTLNDLISAGIDFNEQRFCDPRSEEATDIILIRDENSGHYHFRINMQQTNSFKQLPGNQQSILRKLYDRYFFQMQNELWKTEGEKKLRMLKNSTTMMLCAEDLGMVPDFTEESLHSMNMLSLQVLQMAKEEGKQFSDPAGAGYECVVTPATHDMPPMRLWWEQDRDRLQYFFNDILQEPGGAPYFCEPWICRKIFEMHLASPAAWSIFLMQDILSLNGNIRRAQPAEERINDPANANQAWNYRMHISLEKLLAENEFNTSLKEMIRKNKR